MAKKESNNTLGTVINLIKENPQVARIISKLNKDYQESKFNTLNSNIPNISMSIKDKVNYNEDIVNMFPDIELAIQIMTSSILSPNDMLQNTLIYRSPNIAISPKIKQAILDTIDKYVDLNYNLNSSLTTILRETMFTKGAYIEAVIPEASVDDIIAQHPNTAITMEELSKRQSFGYLGKDTIRVSLEDTTFKIFNTSINHNSRYITLEDLNVEITDNFNILAYSRYVEQSIEYKSRANVYRNIGLEDNQETRSNTEKQRVLLSLDKFFRDKSYYKDMDTILVNPINQASRKSSGKPLVLKLPVESVIPVHVVNNPDKRLGIFVMLDENGNPITTISDPMDNQQDFSYYKTTDIVNDTRSNMIAKTKTALFGKSNTDPELTNIESFYNQMIETILKQKLATGSLGQLADFTSNTSIYKTMLSRSLKSQKTKLLFIPKELVVFYAFEYRDNGTGKSLLEKTSIFYSLRAILLFSRTMASLKNGTSNTEVSVALDEHDPNPDGTSEQIISELLKSRQLMFPLGIIKPADMVEWIQKNGIRVKFEHPARPKIDISSSEASASVTQPDTELEEKINEYIYMSFGLTPEIVQAGYSSDYATTVVAKNLLFAKRLIALQNKFTPMVTDHIRKLLINDMDIITELKTLVKNNLKDIKEFFKDTQLTSNTEKVDDNTNLKDLKDDDIVKYIVDIFIQEISIELPNPETSEAEVLNNAFDAYTTRLDKVLDLIYSSDAVKEELFGKKSETVEPIKHMVKASAMLKWLQDNNYMSELLDVVSKDEEGNLKFDALGDFFNYYNTIALTYLNILKPSIASKVKFDKDYEEFSKEPENNDKDKKDEE